MTRSVRLHVPSLLLLSGCGAGTAAIASGGGDTGGSSNAPAVLSGFTVESPEVSPAVVRFVLADREGDPARVALKFAVGTKAPQYLSHVDGMTSNPTQFASSEDGIAYELPWNFTAERDLSPDGSFVDDVRVTAVLEDGAQEIVLGANGDFGLGNDPPEIESATVPNIEVDGTIGIAFVVSDSSDDVVKIEVRYDIVGDVPDLGWQLARPSLDASTPDYAFEGVVADRKGTALEFFWDTDVDLAELEHDVRMRLTAFDPNADGASFDSAPFHVDNNAEPIALLNDAAWVLNPDQRRGIRIPYRVTDDEEDDVTVVFQWRRFGQSFVELPDTPDSIRAILSDAKLRSQYRVCSEFRTYFEGIAVPVDETHVRLPELSASAAGLLAHGVDGGVGREVELLRGSPIPVSAASEWLENPLARPVAALPIENGARAIVLDESPPGAWRLLDVELATGAVAGAVIAAGDGEPNVMAFEPGEQSVLIATDSASQWQLTRVDLSSGIATAIVQGADGPIRGLASLGTHAALATAGDSLLRLDWNEITAPLTSVVMTDLASPWGIALDPHDSSRLYLAERDAITPNGTGRILSIQLDTHARRTIAVQPIPILSDVLDAAFTGPQDLAVNRSGTRLFVVTQREPRAGTREIRGVVLGGDGTNRGFELAAGLPESARAIAVGGDECVIVSIPTQQDVWLGGGVRAKATIEAYDASRAEITVTPGFAEAVQPLDRWRIEALARDSEPASGVTRQFVWDTADIVVGGEYFVRAVPLDAEIGVASEADESRAVRVPFDGEVANLGSFGSMGSRSVDGADLDGDGDQDLYGSAGHQVVVFLQAADGAFPATPLTLGNYPTTNSPIRVIAADLDGDNDLDLCSANEGDDALAIYFQFGPGSFTPTPKFVGGSSTMDRPSSVVAADLDQDGDLDLCAASGQTGTLSVFFQTSDGEFSSSPLILGGPPNTPCGSAVTAADFDGDGDVDLCGAGRGRVLFFQTSPGVFSREPVIVGDDPTTSGPRDVQSGDVDGDGDVDLCSANVGSSTVSIHLQSSPGVFSDEPVLLEGTSNDFVQRATLADLDSDGDLDICTGNMGSNLVKLFFQTAPGVFADDPIVLHTSWTTYGPESVAAVDLDNDGDLDLCVASPYLSSYWTLYYQTSPGIFPSEPYMLSGPGNVVAAADLDQDGDLDLCSPVSGFLSVIFQTSPGVFPNVPLTIAGLSGLKAIADLDGDADLDLCATSAGRLAIQFQTSAGQFSGEPLILGGERTASSGSAAVADFDGDGDLDVCSANADSTLAIYFQTSAGEFSPEPAVIREASLTDGVARLIAADLDGDADFDLCWCSSAGNSLTILFQTSPGVFSSEPVTLGDSSTTPEPHDVTAADLDGDGDLDLCSANWGGTTLSVFFQISPGVFSEIPRIVGNAPFPLSQQRPQSVAAADVDGDGDLDLCAASNWDSKLAVYTQTSPGVFSNVPRVLGIGLSTPGAMQVLAVDLDGDGDSDLASANVNGSLSIFWNTH